MYGLNTPWSFENPRLAWAGSTIATIDVGVTGGSGVGLGVGVGVGVSVGVSMSAGVAVGVGVASGAGVFVGADVGVGVGSRVTPGCVVIVGLGTVLADGMGLGSSVHPVSSRAKNIAPAPAHLLQWTSTFSLPSVKMKCDDRVDSSLYSNDAVRFVCT